MNYVHHFFDFVERREDYRLMGVTDDPILRHFTIANIYREDDTDTEWFRENIREEVANDPIVALISSVAYRFFGCRQAGAVLKPFLLDTQWSEQSIINRMTPIYERRITASVLKRIRPIMGSSSVLVDPDREFVHSMEAMYTELCRYEFVGENLAWDIVCDLRHTCVMSDATDILTYAPPLVMALSGLGFVIDDFPYMFDIEGSSGGRVPYMIQLLDDSDHPDRPWEMSEVVTSLKQFYKYRMAQLGQGHRLKHPL